MSMYVYFCASCQLEEKAPKCSDLHICQIWRGRFANHPKSNMQSNLLWWCLMEKRSHQKLLYHSRLDQQQARTSPFHGLRFHTAPTCTFSCRKEHSVLFYTTNKQLAKLGIFLQMAKWVKALSTLLKIVCVCEKKKNWTKNILFSSTYLKAAPLIAEDHEA